MVRWGQRRIKVSAGLLSIILFLKTRISSSVQLRALLIPFSVFDLRALRSYVLRSAIRSLSAWAFICGKCSITISINLIPALWDAFSYGKSTNKGKRSTTICYISCYSEYPKAELPISSLSLEVLLHIGDEWSWGWKIVSKPPGSTALYVAHQSLEQIDYVWQ